MKWNQVDIDYFLVIKYLPELYVVVAEFGLDSDNNYLFNLHYATVLMWLYYCPLRVFKTEIQQSREVSESMSDSRMNRVQLTLEQLGFELRKSTYTRFFFPL